MSKKMAVVLLIIIFTFLCFIIYTKSQSDGMKNISEIKAIYKTYSNKRWSFYNKNSKISGDKKNPIENIVIKTKNKTKFNGKIVYRFFLENEKWTDEYDYNSKIINKKINGIKISSTDEIYKNYDVCYRTYNKKNGFMQWSCNGDINGNAKENITGIEIKIIPKGIIKNEYLKDYDESKITSINFK